MTRGAARRATPSGRHVSRRDRTTERASVRSPRPRSRAVAGSRACPRSAQRSACAAPGRCRGGTWDQRDRDGADRPCRLGSVWRGGSDTLDRWRCPVAVDDPVSGAVAAQDEVEPGGSTAGTGSHGSTTLGPAGPGEPASVWRSPGTSSNAMEEHSVSTPRTSREPGSRFDSRRPSPGREEADGDGLVAAVLDRQHLEFVQPVAS